MAKPSSFIDPRSPPEPFTQSTVAGAPDKGSLEAILAEVLPPPKLVMRKSAPEGADAAASPYTYFVPDVAYHLTKFRRGFAAVVNVQGSDHHSTVTRVRAGLQALEQAIPPGYPDYVLHQMVTVMRAGEEVKIGDVCFKRDGVFAMELGGPEVGRGCGAGDACAPHHR